MNQAFHYMSENIEKRLLLEQIAEYLGLSASYFSSCFTQISGISPISYFNKMKIQYSCKLLETTNLKVVEISNKLAFDDPYYFTRLFTKIMGMLPVTYRKMLLNTPASHDSADE